jgi:hypothetical protein
MSTPNTILAPSLATSLVAVASATAPSPAETTTTPPLCVQTAERFLSRKFPPKEPLIDGLLFRRDIVAFAGRRRHGKTTFLSGLATSLTIPHKEFLGYQIPKPRRVIVFFLEDDPGELQQKLNDLLKDCDVPERLAVYTREDFYREGIAVDLNNDAFKKKVETICNRHRPDLIIFDNLAHLIGAAYNDAKVIHKVGTFAWKLTSDQNSAVIIAAHPRKKSGESGDFFGGTGTTTLRGNPEAFFEEVMGSSHFVNSCGSLWGIERDMQTNRTDFLGGTQRLTGEQSLVMLEKDESGRFQVLDAFQENLPLANNTYPRIQAWSLLPDRFSYTEGERAVKSALRSASSFSTWFRHLLRLRVVVPDGEGRYRKATPGPVQPANGPGR